MTTLKEMAVDKQDIKLCNTRPETLIADVTKCFRGGRHANYVICFVVLSSTIVNFHFLSHL